MKIRMRFRRMVRLWVIIRVFVVYGLAALCHWLKILKVYNFLRRVFFLRPMPHSFAQQLRMMIESLGPTFIKLGQMLSTRVDFFSIDTMIELKKLQDNVPAEAEFYIQDVLHKNFEHPLGDDGVFVEFNSVPIAAASIAQVHMAKLADGREVAVKIRRPGIEKTIEADLSLLRWFAAMFEAWFPHYHRLKASRVVEEFAKSICSELNLRAEAAHASRFERNFNDISFAGTPQVLWDCSTSQILTTEWIHGIPIDELDMLVEQGHCPQMMCENLVRVFFHMVFIDGYFHADLHPGNIFVTPSGEIKLVDFGIVGHLEIETRLYLAEMMASFLKRDYRRAAEVHLEAGYVPHDTNISEFEDAISAVCEPIFNRPVASISLAYLLMSLFSVTERFQMETRMELLLLQKTMVVLEGVSRELAPNMNTWEIARPLMLEFASRHMGPKGRMQQKWRGTQRHLEAWLEFPELFKQQTQQRDITSNNHMFFCVFAWSSGSALLTFALLSQQAWWVTAIACLLLYLGIKLLFTIK